MERKTRDRIFEYTLVFLKPLIAIFASVVKGPWASGAGVFALEVFHGIGKKYYSDQDKDLSDKKQDAIYGGQKALQSDLDQLREDQEIYQKEALKLESKNNALKLLNTLINEGYIREKDLLTLAGTSEYFQLFVYSVPATRLLRGQEDRQAVKRRYPDFLQKLGFVRLGKKSSSYLINKATLKDKRLRDPKELKTFLNYHFNKIRRKEWLDCLKMFKSSFPKIYKKFKGKTYKEAGVLQINYLLTESNMNGTNISYVDGDIIGLAGVEDNKKLNQQILKSLETEHPNMHEDVKIKIREVINKLSINFLMEDQKIQDKRKLGLAEDSLKNSFGLNSVVEFYKIHKSDLAYQLKTTASFTRKKSQKISAVIISGAKKYHNALVELDINL